MMIRVQANCGAVLQASKMKRVSITTGEVQHGENPNSRKTTASFSGDNAAGVSVGQ
jgi:hypothetical protein